MTLRFAAPLLLAAAAVAQTPAPRLIRVATGIDSPVDIQHAGDGSGRLFFVEQTGRIRVFKDGALLAAPLLDIRNRVRSGGERGLMGLAFPPGFATKRWFYVNYTEGTGAPDLRTVIARFRLRSGETDIADPASEERLLVIAQPYDNHNGGQLRFSPRDGYLYIGMGDGGSGGDPQNNAQNLDSLLGKMLRLDTESGMPIYSIPPSNPFRDRVNARSEIWAYGLRNPWRFSFDRETGDLYIGDVGQSQLEEIDFQPAASPGGENYGWRVMEGSACYNPPNACSSGNLTLPAAEYGRALGQSVTGGFVYRGSLFPAWRGFYFYADYVSGAMWAMRREDGAWVSRRLPDTGFNVSTFGEDEQGELYLARYAASTGEIYKLVSTTPAVFAGGVTNAASYQTGIVPGSLVTVFGAGVSGAPGIAQASSLPLPVSLDGSAVYFDEIRAPLYAVANVGGREQINAQAPWELAGRGRVSVTVERGGLRSPAVVVDLLPAQPGVFAATFHATGRVVTAAEPAEAGDILVVYATGLGAVDNRPETGQATPASPLAHAATAVTATIGDRDAEVLFAGLTPGFVGLYQVNLRVPAGAGTGSRNLVLRSGAATSPVFPIMLR